MHTGAFQPSSLTGPRFLDLSNLTLSKPGQEARSGVYYRDHSLVEWLHLPKATCLHPSRGPQTGVGWCVVEHALSAREIWGIVFHGMIEV